MFYLRPYSAVRICGMPVSGLASSSYGSLQSMQKMFGTSSIDPSHDLLSPIYNESKIPFPGVKNRRLRSLLQLTQCVLDDWTTPYSISKSDLTLPEIRQSLHQRLENMPSSPTQTGEVYQDGVYEACRLTAVLMIRSLEGHESWFEAAKKGAFLRSCREALSRTNLGDLWGSQIGLLYWIVLVMHTASFRTPHYPFYHGIFSRITFELTYRYDDWYGSVKPLTNLRRIMQICQQTQNPSFADSPTIDFPYRSRHL